jgi:hypothetical protein
MTAADPNFFILLLLGDAVLYGLMPTYGAMMLMLAALWVLGKAPLLFFVLAGAWLLRWFVVDFLLFLVAGWGLRASGFANRLNRRSRYRRLRRRAWTRAELAQMDQENYEAERRARLRRQDIEDPTIASDRLQARSRPFIRR